MLFLIAALFLVSAASSQTITPYTLEQVTRRVDPNGKVRSERTFLMAMNRDGSLASVDLNPDGGQTRQVLDRVRGTNTVVSPVSRSASSSPYRWRGETVPCHKGFSGYRNGSVSIEPSAGKIHDIPVERISVSHNNGTSMEIFMAPSLGCQIMKSVVRQNGAVRETVTTRNFRSGDPDPALFEVPLDYRETRFPR